MRSLLHRKTRPQIHPTGFNLGILLRALFGFGSPRGWANGNQHLQVGSFTFTDAAGNTQTYTMTDVWFGEDRARTLPTELVEVPEEIAALPDVMAFGNVYSLHQAMARDGSGALKSLVEHFAAETDVAARQAILEQLVYTWAGVADVASRFADDYPEQCLPLAA